MMPALLVLGGGAARRVARPGRRLWLDLADHPTAAPPAVMREAGATATRPGLVHLRK
jgi:hypothetical protein